MSLDKGAAETLSYDQYQLDAINCDANTLVSAGAGSGKTSVLASRFIRLVKEGRAGVEHILTLTFTRKAAAEMEDRIYRMLLKNREDARIAGEIDIFNGAQISTLDSFCAQIVRNWPQRFGISPDFVLDDVLNRRLAEEASLDFILANWERPALSEFIYLNGFEETWKGMFAFLAADYVSLASPGQYQKMFTNQMNFLTLKIDEVFTSLKTVFSRIKALSTGISISIDKAQEQLASFPDLKLLISNEMYSDAASALYSLSFRKPGSGSKEDILLFKNYVDHYREIRESFLEILSTLSNKGLIREMLTICEDFEEHILTYKRQQGIVGFHDILKMAVITLKENLPLRRFYKQRFRYIMIDEFQDNNLLQKQLLYLIAEKTDSEKAGIPAPPDLEKDKLYFVGDEKQSIYRFRGADVSVFKALKDELTEAGGKPLALLKNYRSDPKLISFFNTLFKEIMGEVSEDYEAVFEPLEPGDASTMGKAEIKVLYKPYPEIRKEGFVHGDDAEAFYIARFIRETVERKRLEVNDTSTKKTRPAEYDDFALIMRSTGNQIRYERAFRIQGIPYSTEGVRSLFLEAPFNDFFSSLQCSVYPEDRFAWAAFLRSPFVHLSDDTVVRILLSRELPFPEEDPLESTLSEEEQKKYGNGREIYRYLRRWQDRVPIAELVRDLWYKFGYRFSILKTPENHGFLEYYNYLEVLAREFDRDGKCLALFLDFLKKNLGKYERIPDLKIVREKAEGVQLVTIHKSKGLEYPVVILCNTGSAGMGERAGSQPCYISDTFGLTFNLKPGDEDSASRRNYFFRMGKEENKEKEKAELKRLLYVGLTRAQSHLYISGCHNRNNQTQEHIHLNMVLNLVKDDMIEYIPEVSEEEYFRKRGKRGDTDIDEICRKYSQAGIVKLDVPVNRFAVTMIESAELSEEKDDFIELPATDVDAIIDGSSLQAVFGTLCHYVVQKKIEDAFNPDDVPYSLRESVGEEHFHLLLSEALRLSECFFNSSIAEEMNKAKSIETEVPFVYRWGGTEEPVFFNGRIDLLFETVNEVFVVDFKTDRVYSPLRHGIQMEIYRRAAEELSGINCRGVLFYLRGGRTAESDSAGNKGTEERIRAFIEFAKRGKSEKNSNYFGKGRESSGNSPI